MSPLQTEIQALKASASDALKHPMLPKSAGQAVGRLVSVVEQLASELEELRADVMNARRDTVQASMVPKAATPPLIFPSL